MQTVNIEDITNKLKDWFIKQPEIIGIYIAGSLAEGKFDAYADLDIGVVTENTGMAFGTIWKKRNEALGSIGDAFWQEEIIEPNIKTIMVFFDKKLCPPIGLEVDLCISQLQHVNEQRPFSVHQIIYDPKSLLEKHLQKKPTDEFIKSKIQKLQKKINHYPNFVYDALKALERKDLFMFQTMLQELRFMIFLSVIIEGKLVLFEPKKVIHHMNEKEVQIILDTFQEFNEKSIYALVHLLNGKLAQLQVDDELKNKIPKAIKASTIVLS